MSVQLHPTRPAIDLALAGIATIAVALVARQPAIMAWGGALLLGLALARTVTLFSVTRIRAAGFEMLWSETERRVTVGRNQTFELSAEVRNRDTRAARYVHLRSIASPELEIEIEPAAGEVPASGRLRVTVRVRAPRVGRHAIHGLALEVQGSPGLFEVPLTFSNAFGVEVLPAPYGIRRRSARGGRSRATAEGGRPGMQRGDGMEIKELREHQSGDAFKRIAWKASARRGRLMVREYHPEEREIVWLVVDASVELWSGRIGDAPLDAALDSAAAVAIAHLEQGDRVGLEVVGARSLASIPPDTGYRHQKRLLTVLGTAASTLDWDRSGWDEHDVGARVLEHMRPMHSDLTVGVQPTELDRIARRALELSERGPFPPLEPRARTPEDTACRAYLSAFGVTPPPRLEPERPKTDIELIATITRLLRARPSPSRIIVWSPAPDPHTRPELESALKRLSSRRVALSWVSVPLDSGLEDTSDDVARVVAAAVSIRARVARRSGELALRRAGVKVLELQPRARRRATSGVRGG